MATNYYIDIEGRVAIEYQATRWFYPFDDLMLCMWGAPNGDGITDGLLYRFRNVLETWYAESWEISQLDNSPFKYADKEMTFVNNVWTMRKYVNYALYFPEEYRTRLNELGYVL